MGKEDEIRLIAYKIWEEEGCQHGRDCEHWFRAEAIWDQQQHLKMMNDLMKNIRNLAAHHCPIDDDALMILEKCYQEWLNALAD